MSFQIGILLIVLVLMIAAVIVIYISPIANMELKKETRSSVRWRTTEENQQGNKVTTTEEFEQTKTLWDLQQILIIPLAIALITIIFSTLQNINSEQLALDQQRQTTLESYMDRMANLLSSTNVKTMLHDSQRNTDEIRKVARANTLVALRTLDPERKRIIVQFLYNADLITWHRWPGMPGGDFPIVNIVGADLSGADLSNMYLADADLNGTLLNHANLSNTDLTISNLFKTDLQGANLNRTRLNGADLRQSNLSGDDLRTVQLQGSHWPDGTYKEANLSGATLRGVNLNGNNLHGAQLARVPLDDGTRLGADLSNASLCYTDLSRANLSGATLKGTNLSGANLRGAILSGAGLEEAILGGATMPDGSQSPFRERFAQCYPPEVSGNQTR